MKILLSNDDGFDAPGIKILASTLAAKGHEVTIVAPSEEKSGNSHAMTFFQPILVKQVEENVFSVNGTPADCVAIALHDILKTSKPDLVISGINNGWNVGRDVNYSGTVGAATEAALEGYKAIAISCEYFSGAATPESINYLKFVAHFMMGIVGITDKISWPKDEVLNINYPAGTPKGIMLANSNSTSFYESFIDKMYPHNSQKKKHLVYMIGGAKKKENLECDEDVSYICKGYIVMSFLRCRQSSTEHASLFSPFINDLEALLPGLK